MKMMLTGLILFICCFLFVKASITYTDNEIQVVFEDVSYSNSRSSRFEFVPIEKINNLSVTLTPRNENYGWYLRNEEDIKNSEDIKLIKSEVDTSGQYNKYIFNFSINETASIITEFPSLMFIEANESKDEIILKNEVIPFIKGKRLEELLPVKDININDLINNEPIEVESNSILNIVITGGGYIPALSTKFDKTEIESSNVIEYIGEFYRENPDLCSCDRLENICTCVEDIVSKFLIKSVQSEDVVPKIVFNRNRSDLVHYEIPLKITSKECSFNGYKCCSKEDATVRYHDEDGDWGVENHEWCYIKRPELIRTCEINVYDFPCSKENYMSTSDITHKSYIVKFEDRIFGQYSCLYTGKYPVCQNTTKVVYTDTQKWGVENNQWCVMCF